MSRASRAPGLEALADDRRRGAAEIAARLLEWAGRWSEGASGLPERAVRVDSWQGVLETVHLFEEVEG